MTWYVYALKDPRDGSIRYVGKSSNPARRLASHCSSSAANEIRSWVAVLSAAPELTILGRFECETDALLFERNTIAELLNSGVPLLNRQPGGNTQGIRRQHFGGIGQRLLQRRRQLRLTQDQLAAQSGLDRPRLSRIEHGVRDQITAVTAVLLARALDVSVEWLITGEERRAKVGAA